MLLTKLARARQLESTYGHLITGEKGYQNILSGEIFLTIKCVPKTVTIIETKNCYKNIPIIYEGKEQFLETQGYTIVANGKQIPCSRLTPPTFHINGRWISINNIISLAPQPTVLKPTSYLRDLKFSTVDNYVLAGLYSKEQITNFMNFLLHPQKISVAQETINNRLIANTPMQNISQLSLEAMFTKEHLKKWKDSFVKDLESKVLYFGSWTGFVIGIIIVVQASRYLISTIVNVKHLHKSLGFGIHMFAAMFTSVTAYLTKPLETNERQGTENHIAIEMEATEEFDQNQV